MKKYSTKQKTSYEFETIKTSQEIIQRDSFLIRNAVQDEEYRRKYSSSDYGDYKTSRKASTARNYRNRDIYDHVTLKGITAESMQPEAESIAYLCSRKAAVLGSEINLSAITQKPVDKEFDVELQPMLLRLSKNLPASVDAEMLVKTTRSLTAAAGEKGANSKNAEKIADEGLACLKEIYARKLDEIEEKYGAKIAGISAIDYLKNMDEIDRDFACLADMKKFLIDQHMLTDSAEETRIRKSLTFYTSVYDLLQERKQHFVDMDETIDLNGEMTKEAKSSYKQRMTAVLQEAGKSMFSEKNKRKKIDFADLMTQTKSMKDMVLTSKAELAVAEEREKGKDKEADEIEDKLAKRSAYLLAKATASLMSASKTETMRARATIKRYEGSADFLSQEDAVKLQERLDEIAAERAVEEITDENVDQFTEKLQKMAEWFEKTYASDDVTFAKSFKTFVETGRKLQEYRNIIRTSEYMLTAESYVKKHMDDPEAQKDPKFVKYKQIMDWRKAYEKKSGSPTGIMEKGQARLSQIEKQGYSETVLSEVGREHEEIRAKVKTTIQSEQAKELDLKGAIAITRKMSPDLIAHIDSEETAEGTISKVRELLRAAEVIKACKKSDRSAYMFGQTYEDYCACERLLHVLPQIKEVYGAFLSTIFINEEGEYVAGDATFDERKEHFASAKEEYKAAYQKSTEQFTGSIADRFENVYEKEGKLVSEVRGKLSSDDILEGVLAFVPETYDEQEQEEDRAEEIAESLHRYCESARNYSRLGEEEKTETRNRAIALIKMTMDDYDDMMAEFEASGMTDRIISINFERIHALRKKFKCLESTIQGGLKREFYSKEKMGKTVKEIEFLSARMNSLSRYSEAVMLEWAVKSGAEVKYAYTSEVEKLSGQNASVIANILRNHNEGTIEFMRREMNL